MARWRPSPSFVATAWRHLLPLAGPSQKCGLPSIFVVAGLGPAIHALLRTRGRRGWPPKLDASRRASSHETGAPRAPFLCGHDGDRDALLQRSRSRSRRVGSRSPPGLAAQLRAAKTRHENRGPCAKAKWQLAREHVAGAPLDDAVDRDRRLKIHLGGQGRLGRKRACEGAGLAPGAQEMAERLRGRKSTLTAGPAPGSGRR